LARIAKFEQILEEKIKELNLELPGKNSTCKIASQNCAALTMKGFLEIINTNDSNLINMATPLASITNICGAVNAGLIIGKKGEKEIHQLIAAAEGVKFLTQFKKRFGTIHCQELTGYDLMTREGMQNYMNDNIWEKTCYKYVVTAIEIIGSLYKNQIAKVIAQETETSL
jgi:hypothetical protein